MKKLLLITLTMLTLQVNAMYHIQHKNAERLKNRIKKVIGSFQDTTTIKKKPRANNYLIENLKAPITKIELKNYDFEKKMPQNKKFKLTAYYTGELIPGEKSQHAIRGLTPEQLEELAEKPPIETFVVTPKTYINFKKFKQITKSIRQLINKIRKLHQKK